MYKLMNGFIHILIKQQLLNVFLGISTDLRHMYVNLASVQCSMYAYIVSDILVLGLWTVVV